jgi:chromosome segregation ATPase
MEREIRQLQDTVRRLEHQKRSAEGQLPGYRYEIDALKEQIAEYENGGGPEHAKYVEALELVKQLNKKVRELVYENRVLDTKIAAAVEAKRVSEGQTMRLLKEKMELDKQVAQLEEEKRVLDHRYLDLKTKKEQLGEEKITKQNEAEKALEVRILQLSRQKRLLELKVAQLEDEKKLFEKNFELIEVKADLITNSNAAVTLLIKSLPEMITEAVVKGLAIEKDDDRKGRRVTDP